MKSKLIFDVGAFRGEDAEFYLRKGFHVVSLEANPEFAAAALARNSAAAKEGRYRIVNAALAESSGEIDLFVHENGDWSTTKKNFRFDEKNHHTIKVPCITAQALFQAYGVPYYAKVDIEGRDNLIINEICKLELKPRYVSYELGVSTRNAAEQLRACGYSKFAIVPQSQLSSLKLTRPPLEGQFVDYQFTGLNSGPFGRELPTEWLDFEAFCDAMAGLDSGRGLKEWWDIHAYNGGAAFESMFMRERFGEQPLSKWELPVSGEGQQSRDVSTASAGAARAAGTSSIASSSKIQAAVDDVGKDWKRAKYYDEAEAAMDLQWKNLIWPCIKDCNFDIVVDLACGHGRNTNKLREISKKVISIDLNQENIDFCIERFSDSENVTVMKNNGKDLSILDNESVTLVYCFDAMVHFDSDVIRAYLSDIFRVLKVRGHAFLHHSAMEQNPTGSFRDTPGWRNFMTPALMAHWAHKEGLAVVGQSAVDWRHDGTIKDCLTLLKKWR